MKRLKIFLISIFFVAILSITAHAEINKETAYRPNGNEFFIAFKSYNKGLTVAYFNEAISVIQNANYYELKGKFIYKNFASIEELEEFCKIGGEGLQESTKLYIAKNEENIYAMNCKIQVSESEIWEEKSYTEGGTTEGSTTEEGILGSLKAWFSSIIKSITELKDAFIKTVETAFKNVSSAIENIINAIKENISSLTIKIENKFTELIKNITEFANSVKEFFSSFFEKIAGIFIPEKTVINTFKSILKEKFEFVFQIKEIFITLKECMNPTEPPKITITLPQKFGGGTHEVLNTKILEPYRNDIKDMISCFLWLGYGFMLIKRIPEILNGMGMVTEYTTKINGGNKNGS